MFKDKSDYENNWYFWSSDTEIEGPFDSGDDALEACMKYYGYDV